ncbi:hypothetical protein CAC42_3821 [Sphaceloma murrayae]|uniref:Uncharacterized protein n=1 Tax=Sphaceloma murrayae TaxID=2082308 RepID=A0A2K1QH98_9PEZI|nr:hypothetical protein CAC42_3821 [Sphaceloma murrayae]
MTTVEPLGASRAIRSSPPAPSSISMKPWRTNLTGLSDDYNLFFVAHASEIVVFEPKFPTQELPPIFSLVVSTPPSQRGLRGHIDPRHPHAINNLVVGHLGSEEVLAVVRDDGDVDAYLTKHIARAIELRQSESNSMPLLANELRPLLHRNVGNSAWGLALHQEARLIAVSSNNHEFNIFAFGLVDQDEDSASNSDTSRTQLSGRQRDEHIRLPNGGANIPSISFCNNGHDREGRYLLTTDISGLTRYWDLHDRAGPQGIYVGRTPRESSDFNEDSAGWSVAFLDPRGFAEVDDFDAAAFAQSARPFADLKSSSPAWDLTAARVGVAAAGARYQTTLQTTTQQPRGVRGGTPSQSRQVLSQDNRSRTRTTESQVNQETEDEDAKDLPGDAFVERIRKVILSIGGHDDSPSANGSSTSDDAEDAIDNVDESLVDEDSDEALDDEALDQNAQRTSGTLGNRREHLEYGDLLDATPFDTAATAPRSRRLIRRELQIIRRLYADQYNDLSTLTPDPTSQDLYLLFANDTAMCPALPCPIFIASVEDMYMLQPAAPATDPALRGAATDHLPLILVGNAFKSPMFPTPDFDLAFDDDYLSRCSLVAQIPSLGVLVVGNQQGKVAVMSGFKSLQKIDIKGPRGTRVKGVKWVYGLKLEAVLPFRRQEREGLRPHTQLYGLAVGKMQGCLRRERKGQGARERWRLMVTWLDETILSYEIGRKGGEIGVEELVI